MKKYISILLLSFIGLACEDESNTPPAQAPTNLIVNIDKSKSNEGIISITATADNENYFEFDFGDNTGRVRDDDGVISYTYQSSGTYEIEVRANTTSSVYINYTEEVIIDKENTNPPDEGYTTPLAYDGYTLVWQDEFDGTALSSDWTHEIGTGSNGWGNNELQYYRSQNTSVANGYLTIEAKKETFGGQQYTSSRIVTMGKQSFRYGRVDIRATLPKGQGIWPALWMLGSNFTTVGWPSCGEIDIMEMVGGGGKENTVHGTVHWDNAGSYASYGQSYTKGSGTFSDKFHVFSIIWDDTQIRWFVDDQLYNTIDITPAGLSEFKEEFFFIFNVAVGGNWPGSPDGSTSFPQQMTVDYVRVFQAN
ncbi:glycoside hydrolase family 16 protein [Marinigracilibium pacificum]|uniref:Glycoside hydrolase family 16 protein n=1 Tax=Marinigracilibium pacificum TaxID=2729599 RepID=A0A848J2I9_9BACT|nr:glycoside hydrolase family 16 protein [Marinigracilibium pacificum]NMM48539.1 glycoside hydrolase family 16 protein [Marinigracilibium pacificum]